ncbi:MAG: cytochrome c3 family protein [Nibricoccus sp.]
MVLRRLCLACVGVGLLLAADACRKPLPTRPKSVAAAMAQRSTSCRECHEEIFLAWAETDHALANRPVDLTKDAEALATFHSASGVGPGTAPEFILGHKPLWQPLFPSGDGRWQPHELAYDPAKKDWFNVFGAENRQPGEWGHWTGRGMNWNSMCAQCHMTGYQKNYSPATDTYKSTWVEHGVGCIQCHGPTTTTHGRAAKKSGTSMPQPPFYGDRGKMMQTCATCHARGEPIAPDFQPGDPYNDFFRAALPVHAATFYPDGQQRDEDFNWTSILLSRMGHAGVTCMDCHDPHTTRTRLPANDNALCLQCHGGEGRVQANGTRAIPIDPTSHSHHKADNAGNTCVGCHMPTTNYMQRAPRHDHGWLKPDPLMTQELGIPNACSKCHADKPLEWNIAKANEWYGEKLNSKQRARARAVVAAQANKTGAAARLYDLFATEDIPAWRATFLSLLVELPDRDSARDQAVAAQALASSDPIERAAAVRLLGKLEGSAEQIRLALQDPVRLVRIEAEWLLSAELPADSTARKELDAYLALDLDQPGGRFRLGTDLANRDRADEAEKEILQATKWDPHAAGYQDALGLLLAGQGRSSEAAVRMDRAAGLAPSDDGQALRAALAWAEAGDQGRAEYWMRQSVTRDPQLDRGWYNLGLLLAQQENLAEAAEALSRAEQLRPESPDYSYALATVLARKGDRAGALAAVQRALKNAPAHRKAQSLLRSLSR